VPQNTPQSAAVGPQNNSRHPPKWPRDTPPFLMVHTFVQHTQHVLLGIEAVPSLPQSFFHAYHKVFFGLTTKSFSRIMKLPNTWLSSRGTTRTGQEGAKSTTAASPFASTLRCCSGSSMGLPAPRQAAHAPIMLVTQHPQHRSGVLKWHQQILTLAVGGAKRASQPSHGCNAGNGSRLWAVPVLAPHGQC